LEPGGRAAILSVIFSISIVLIAMEDLEAIMAWTSVEVDRETRKPRLRCSGVDSGGAFELSILACSMRGVKELLSRQQTDEVLHIDSLFHCIHSASMAFSSFFQSNKVYTIT
jgi:hypothetical protein